MLNLDDLNPAQRDAVLAPEGPILILAGAGSGKTRVLTYRIAHLLAERKAAPERMLAVTFTNKAAGEMRERIATLVGENSRWPWVSTFHSACARILRQEAEALGFRPNFSILDEGDAMAVMRRVIEEAALAGAPTPEMARARIEQLKNDAVGPAAFAESVGGDGREAALATIYRLYRERLRAMNAMDFSDLLLNVHEIFERDPGVLLRWQSRAEHLLVDEYQDTNRVQYLLVRALSARSSNLCVVGDEDQSIYRWRGADIRNILDFERDFPQARIFKLEQNYRSTKTILAAADTVIRNNRERKEKRLWTENASGELVTYFTGVTERDEADFIAREIGRLTAEGGTDPADIVVFYRVNAQARVIEEALVRRRVPYYVVGGLRFYEHREVKDLLAYLRVLANPADTVSVERMVGAPTRGVGAKTLEAAAQIAAEESVTAFEALGRLETNSRVALRAAKQAGELYGWMHDLAGRAPSMKVRAILDEVIARAGFLGYLDAMPDGAARRQNVAEMLSAADAFDAEGQNGGLRRFPRARGPGQRRRPGRGPWRTRRADDVAYLQGPRVPGGVHRGDGGGIVSAFSLARRRTRGRGGAPAVLRRDDARAAAPVPDQHADARALRPAQRIAALALPGRDRSRSDHADRAREAGLGAPPARARHLRRLQHQPGLRKRRRGRRRRPRGWRPRRPSDLRSRRGAPARGARRRRQGLGPLRAQRGEVAGVEIRQLEAGCRLIGVAISFFELFDQAMARQKGWA